jgi:hypothetical protein
MKKLVSNVQEEQQKIEVKSDKLPSEIVDLKHKIVGLCSQNVTDD